MTVKTGHAWAGTFVTLDATGALAASADAAGVLYIDGTADAAAVTITGSNPYKWAVTLPTLTAGQRVDMYITGTIGTIATAGIVASEQADTSLTSEVKTETAAILADTGTDGVVLKAAGLNADAVAEIQSGLALEATLTAIKGAGWSIQTLSEIYNLLSDGFGGRSVEDTVNAALTPILGAGWTDETLVAIDALLDAIKAKSDLIPASPPTAAEVWASPIRTLTNQGAESVSPAVGDPLVIYRDTTVIIQLTGLGDSTGDAGTKIFFTAKENLEDADASSIIQVVCIRANPITDPDTGALLYINKVAPTSPDEGAFVFEDHTDGTAVITIKASAAADLPIYAATPLYWDVKMVTNAGAASTILETGTMYIYGTSTRTVAV